MSIVLLIIVGAAAGFIATRLMRIEADIITTIAIGIFGALIGGLVLRFLLAVDVDVRRLERLVAEEV